MAADEENRPSEDPWDVFELDDDLPDDESDYGDFLEELDDVEQADG